MLTTLAAVGMMLSASIFAHDGADHGDADRVFTPRAIVPNNDGGQWGPVEDWPVLGVHGTVLPTGEVFVWDSTPDDQDTPDQFGTTPDENFVEFHNVQRNQTRVTVWNPETNTHKSTYNPEGSGDLFCAGSVHLPDGRIIFAGGDSGTGGKNGPHENSNIYNPWTNTWTSTDNMQAARWYSSVATLATGEVLTFGGSYAPDPTGEILKANEKWRQFEDDIDTNIILSGDYSWLGSASDGSIVYFGPHNQVNSLYTKELFGEDKWVNGPKRDIAPLSDEDGSYRGYGSYAMYDTDKVLVSGGGQSESSTVIIDALTRETVETTPMHFGRRQHNLTIMADGQVLATGGNSTGADLLDSDAGILTPEVWNPETETWTMMNDMKTDRQYHSIALLLPDARVLLAGSGYCIPCFQQDHEQQNAEIFSPPYLFNGPRPVITQAPDRVNYNQEFTLDIANTDVERAHLIKLSSVTHSQSQDQRLVKLDIVRNSGDELTLSSPATRLIAPPGHYMLFVVNAAGVPSEAAIVNIGQVLLSNTDVAIKDTRAGEWEYYEVNGADTHTVTATLTGNLDTAKLAIGNGGYPTSETGFDSCNIIRDDEIQCTVTASDTARWYIGVFGAGVGSYSIEVNVSAGDNPQQNNFIAAPNTPTARFLDFGDYRLQWGNVAGAVRYAVYRDGRLHGLTDTTTFVDDNLKALSLHTYQIAAIGADESRSVLSPAMEVRTSTDPYYEDPTTVYNPIIPSIPTGLRMKKTSATNGTLLWQRSWDDKGVDGYIVYLDGEEIGRREDSGISFSQPDLIAGVSYTYQVASYDVDGNVSARSVDFTTTGSLFVPADNEAPELSEFGFNPVATVAQTEGLPPPVNLPPNIPVEPEMPVVETPDTPDTPDTPTSTSSTSSGGSLGLLGLLGLIMLNIRRIK